MTSENDQENCIVCDGEKVSIPSLQDVKEGEEIELQPIQCQHCNGTGKEPK